MVRPRCTRKLSSLIQRTGNDFAAKEEICELNHLNAMMRQLAIDFGCETIAYHWLQIPFGCEFFVWFNSLVCRARVWWAAARVAWMWRWWISNRDPKILWDVFRMIFFAPERWCCKIKKDQNQSWVFTWSTEARQKSILWLTQQYRLHLPSCVWHSRPFFSVLPHVGALRPIWNESEIYPIWNWKSSTSGNMRKNVAQFRFDCGLSTICYFTFALLEQMRKNRIKKEYKKIEVYCMNYIVREYEREMGHAPPYSTTQIVLRTRYDENS